MSREFEEEKETFKRLLKDPRGVAFANTTNLLLVFSRVCRLLATSKSEAKIPSYEKLYRAVRNEIDRRIPPLPMRSDW